MIRARRNGKQISDRHGSRPPTNSHRLGSTRPFEPPRTKLSAAASCPRRSRRRRSRSWLTRWQPVAAAAAVTGLAFVLVQMLPRPQPPVHDEAASPTSTAKPIDSTDMELDKRGVPAPAAPPPAVGDRQSANSITRSEAIPARAKASAAQVEQGDATAPQVSAEAAPPGTAAPESAARQGIAASVSAADWAARVAALHDSGDTAQAADTLRAFRAVYPEADGYLAESLRAWARTIE